MLSVSKALSPSRASMTSCWSRSQPKGGGPYLSGQLGGSCSSHYLAQPLPLPTMLVSTPHLLTLDEADATWALIKDKVGKVRGIRRQWQSMARLGLRWFLCRKRWEI